MKSKRFITTLAAVVLSLPAFAQDKAAVGGDAQQIERKSAVKPHSHLKEKLGIDAPGGGAGAFRQEAAPRPQEGAQAAISC